MKHFLIVLFVVLTQHVYSQMTVNELIKIHKMNFDQFDSYALAKGYELIDKLWF